MRRDDPEAQAEPSGYHGGTKGSIPTARLRRHGYGPDSRGQPGLLVLWLALLVGVEAIGMNVSPGHLAAATFASALLAFAFGAIALFLGAALGRRGAAIGIAAAGAVAAYLLSSLAELVGFLKPLRGASPFYHYAANDALGAGLAVEHVGFLLLLGAAAVVAALVAFERRDLATP